MSCLFDFHSSLSLGVPILHVYELLRDNPQCAAVFHPFPSSLAMWCCYRIYLAVSDSFIVSHRRGEDDGYFIYLLRGNVENLYINFFLRLILARYINLFEGNCCS
jgi:hypothetical protein